MIMTDKLRAKGPWWEMSPYIRARESFVTHGSLSGREVTGPLTYIGQLNEVYRESVEAADYIVFSYDTPIAWHRPDGWQMPDVRYSVTTSAHQGKVRTCLGDRLI